MFSIKGFCLSTIKYHKKHLIRKKNSTEKIYLFPFKLKFFFIETHLILYFTSFLFFAKT